MAKTEQAAYYAVEADKLEYLLKTVGVNEEQLSIGGDEALKCLTSLALTFPSPDLSSTRFMLALQELSQNEEKLKQQFETKRKEAIVLLMKSTKAKDELAIFTSTLTKCEADKHKNEAVMLGRINDIKYTQHKSQEYRNTKQQLAAEIKANQVREGITHPAIINQASHLQTLNKELESINIQLQSYHNLPPDQALAEKEIQQVQKELTRIERELATRIRNMNLKFDS
jgi:chromosome segregation ATPase